MDWGKLKRPKELYEKPNLLSDGKSFGANATSSSDVNLSKTVSPNQHHPKNTTQHLSPQNVLRSLGNKRLQRLQISKLKTGTSTDVTSPNSPLMFWAMDLPSGNRSVEPVTKRLGTAPLNNRRLDLNALNTAVPNEKNSFRASSAPVFNITDKFPPLQGHTAHNASKLGGNRVADKQQHEHSNSTLEANNPRMNVSGQPEGETNPNANPALRSFSATSNHFPAASTHILNDIRLGHQSGIRFRKPRRFSASVLHPSRPPPRKHHASPLPLHSPSGRNRHAQRLLIVKDNGSSNIRRSRTTDHNSYPKSSRPMLPSTKSMARRKSLQALSPTHSTFSPLLSRLTSSSTSFSPLASPQEMSRKKFGKLAPLLAKSNFASKANCNPHSHSSSLSPLSHTSPNRSVHAVKDPKLMRPELTEGRGRVKALLTKNSSNAQHDIHGGASGELSIPVGCSIASWTTTALKAPVNSRLSINSDDLKHSHHPRMHRDVGNPGSGGGAVKNKVGASVGFKPGLIQAMESTESQHLKVLQQRVESLTSQDTAAFEKECKSVEEGSRVGADLLDRTHSTKRVKGEEDAHARKGFGINDRNEDLDVDTALAGPPDMMRGVSLDRMTVEDRHSVARQITAGSGSLCRFDDGTSVDTRAMLHQQHLRVSSNISHATNSSAATRVTDGTRSSGSEACGGAGNDLNRRHFHFINAAEPEQGIGNGGASNGDSSKDRGGGNEDHGVEAQDQDIDVKQSLESVPLARMSRRGEAAAKLHPNDCSNRSADSHSCSTHKNIESDDENESSGSRHFNLKQMLVSGARPDQQATTLKKNKTGTHSASTSSISSSTSFHNNKKRASETNIKNDANDGSDGKGGHTAAINTLAKSKPGNVGAGSAALPPRAPNHSTHHRRPARRTWRRSRSKPRKSQASKKAAKDAEQSQQPESTQPQLPDQLGSSAHKAEELPEAERNSVIPQKETQRHTRPKDDADGAKGARIEGDKSDPSSPRSLPVTKKPPVVSPKGSGTRRVRTPPNPRQCSRSPERCKSRSPRSSKSPVSPHNPIAPTGSPAMSAGEGVRDSKSSLHVDSVKLIRVIGTGGYAKVWLGSFEGRDVAVKQLAAPTSSVPLSPTNTKGDVKFSAPNRQRRRGNGEKKKSPEEVLEREVSILKRFCHKNIVQYIGLFVTGGWSHGNLYNIVMEYVPDGDLNAFIRKNGKLSEALAASLTSQVSSGLKYLHKHKVIHRDLKPANLLLCKHYSAKREKGKAKKVLADHKPDMHAPAANKKKGRRKKKSSKKKSSKDMTDRTDEGVNNADGNENENTGVETCTFIVKISDFGVSANITGEEAATKRSCVGTPWYLAPEVARVQPYSYPADIWSLGSVIYAMVTGHKPYHNLAPIPALFKIAREGPPAPPPEASSACKELILGCWKKVPSDRLNALEVTQHAWMKQHNL